jgi:D-alanyl-D-alanine carboxypeptidase
MKTRIALSVLLAVFFAAETHAQSFNKAKLDSLFDVLAAKNKAMGSVALSKDGVILYQRAIGYSAITGSDKVAASTATKYRIGSISKMFTATIILQLVEEGRLTLSATLDQFFPDLPNAGQITISDLLHHRSGLHDFTSDADYRIWMTQPKSEEDMLAIVSKGKPDFSPGQKYAYSNTNYLILSYIIEKICQEPYSKVLTSRITSKIGLTNTYIGGKTNIQNNESYSYYWLKDWNQLPETDMSIPSGAGAILSTPGDLDRFIEALFNLELFSKSSLDQMTTLIDGYGMGMVQIPFYEKKAYGHNGAIDGFISSLSYFPEDHLVLAYCTNGHVYSMNDILIGVLSIYFNRDYTIPVFKTLSISSGDLDKYLGVYSSKQLPLKITITKNDTILTAQATGQPSFPLEATDKDIFKFDAAGIQMAFTPDKGEMTLKQGGGTYLFIKEK